MLKRLTVLAILMALLTPVLAPAATSSAASAAPESPTAVNPLVGIPINGTIPSIGGTFSGLLNITSFAAQAGQLVANGNLTGTLYDAAGNIIGTVTNLPITLPLAVTGTCQILHLDLGPLDLTLLGLNVHLNRVVLDITAQSGPGNLLGNLLCAIAHLLDNPASPLAGVANLLNQVLAVLGRL